MERDYLDFEVSIEKGDAGQVVRVTGSPAGSGQAAFTLPFTPVELAQFMTAVGPPRVASRRLVPAATRVMDVKDYGQRLGSALLAGEVGQLFRTSLSTAKQQGAGLRVRLGLEDAPDLEPIPWEYLYDSQLGRFLTLSSQTPIVRSLDALDMPPVVTVTAPLRVLVMISSPSDMPELAVAHEEELLRATTADLVTSGRLELVVMTEATLGALQRALLETFHVFHFVGHGGFDQSAGEGVLVLEREDGTAHRVGASRLGTLLHDAAGMQLVVLNACEGARTNGRDAFSGVAQALVRQGLPAVVAMQTEISDRAALVFSHEFYYFLTRGLSIDAAICEVRKAMATSDEASEWGTAVLVRSGSDQPFDVTALSGLAEPAPEGRYQSLYAAAQNSLASSQPETAVPILEQLAAERPDDTDVTTLLQRVKSTPATDSDEPIDEGPVGAGAGRSTSPPRPVPLVDLPPPTPPAAAPRPPASPRGGHGLKWAVVILAVLLAATVGFIILAVSMADDPQPAPQGAQQGQPTSGASPGPSSTEPGPSAAVDPAVAACGPSAAVPSVDGSLLVGCATTAPVIDGSFADWDNVAPITVADVVFPRDGSNPGNVHGEARLAWNVDGLFVEASVVDPSVRDVNESQPDQYWRGDAISFEFGPDARQLGRDAGVRNGRDRHVIIGISSGRALGSMNLAAGGDFPAGAAVPEIQAAMALTDDGYRVEARVPWSVLGVSSPSRGAIFAGNVDISDAKASTGSWALGTMVSSNPERVVQRRPAIWQPIVLGDPS